MISKPVSNIDPATDTSLTGEAERLLNLSDGRPVEVLNAEGKSSIVLICEHASNRIPEKLASLGLSDEQLKGHVAWDPGAYALAMAMSATLNAPLVAARFSRLAYDCNRPPEAETAMPQHTEQGPIPGNKALSHSEKTTRAAEIYAPFHGAAAEVLSQKRNLGSDPVVVTIHSFTPVFNGQQRQVEVGFLHSDNDELAQAMLRHSSANDGFDIRLNQPYGPKDGVLHTIDLHASKGAAPHVMIEIRNDLLCDEKGVQRVHNMIVDALTASLRHTDKIKAGTK